MEWSRENLHSSYRDGTENLMKCKGWRLVPSFLTYSWNNISEITCVRSYLEMVKLRPRPRNITINPNKETSIIFWFDLLRRLVGVPQNVFMNIVIAFLLN